MRINKQKKGQFIIIAALIIAIMMIAVGVVMYNMVTYFKHRQWEDYLAVVDNVEVNTQRVMEVGLANYTVTMNQTVLGDNIDQWKNDLRKVYPGFGVGLKSSLAEGSYSSYGSNITYVSGLARHWYGKTSFSAANATFTLNLTSVGLTGYDFMAIAFLKVNIFDSYWHNSTGDVVTYLAVEKENLVPVTDLQKNSFSLSVDSQAKNFTLSYYFNQTYNSYVYRLYSASASSTQPSYVLVSVVDTRNIKVVAVESPTGGTIMYDPTDDAWVESKNPDDNMGMQTVIHVRRDPGDPGNIRRTYMKYNLSEIPYGSEIISARFWGYCKAANPAVDIQLDLYAAASDDWSEDNITWNNAPPPDILVASALIDGAGKYYPWDITWFFKQEYEGDKMMSLVIRMPYENSSTFYHRDFFSAESTTNRPYIEVEHAKTPNASFTYSPSNPAIYETVNFNATASYDPDGFLMEYQWDFGDGTPLIVEFDPLATHVYTSAGNYTVTLTVIDIQGLDKSYSKTVNVS